MEVKRLTEKYKTSSHPNKCMTLKFDIINYKYNFLLIGETGLPGEPGRPGLQGFPGPKGKFTSEI